MNTNTWQPIETAPKDGTDVILYEPNAKRGFINLGRYVVRETLLYGKSEHKSEGWCVPASVLLFAREPKPTHWMALPEAPSV